MAAHGTLLVVGSGPGIGVHVAKVFAERGFRRVILASRNEGRLVGEVDEVKAAAAGVEVLATTVDLASKGSVDAAVAEWEGMLQGGPRLEAVLFNAARIGPSTLFDFTAEEVERDLQVGADYLFCSFPFHCTGLRFPLPLLQLMPRMDTDLRHLPLHHRRLGVAKTRTDRQRRQRSTFVARDLRRAGQEPLPALLLPGHVQGGAV